MRPLHQQPVADLIPHRPPMALLSQILAADQQSLWSLIRLHPQSPFASAAGVPAGIALEYLAQTAAAFFTAQAQLAAATEAQSELPLPQAGMLIGCSKLQCDVAWFSCPDTLLAEVTLTSALPRAETGGGLVRFNGQLVQLTVPLPPDLTPAALQALTGEQRQLAAGSLSVYLPPAAVATDSVPTREQRIDE